MSEKKERKPPLTIEIMDSILKAENISVRFNLITKETEINGVPDILNPDDLLNDLPIWIHDRCKGSFTCNKDQISDLIKVLAGQYRYNPVDELLQGVRWDGADRIAELFEIMGITHDDLSQKLMERWLNMAWKLAHNDSADPEGADGMLVLVGPQGCGKTSLVRQLGASRGLYRLGAYIDPKDKDTLKRATGAWIVELAEIETTLRGDLERLKAFITAERDEIRLPYARADRRTARRTAFIGTCNGERFLIDPTGSRRFWTIPVQHIDIEALREFDAVQLWAQVAFVGKSGNYPFRLTPKEQADLATRNCEHERPVKAQFEVEDILADADSRPGAFEWAYVSVSDFKADYPSLNQFSVEQIGKACDKLGIQATRKTIDGRQCRTRRLPLHRWGVQRKAR